LQRLVYLSPAAFLLPIQMLIGFLYWSCNCWSAWGLGWLSRKEVVVMHLAGEFAIRK